MTNSDDEEDEEEDANFIEEDQEQDSVGPSNTSCLKATFSIQFLSLQQYLDARNKLVDKRMERLAARQEHMFATQNSFNATLVERLAHLDPYVEPFQFPVPQPMSVYPPSDPKVEVYELCLNRQLFSRRQTYFHFRWPFMRIVFQETILFSCSSFFTNTLSTKRVGTHSDNFHYNEVLHDSRFNSPISSLLLKIFKLKIPDTFLLHLFGCKCI